MSEQTPRDDAQAPPPLWQFVGLDAYRRPDEPVRASVRKGLRSLWERLRNRDDVPEAVIDPAMLSEIAPDRLDRVAPVPDWAEAVTALEEALGDRLASEGSSPSIAVIVAPPYSGVPEVLAAWARVHRSRLFAAPDPDEILRGGETWLARLAGEPETPLVLPCLAHCFLRHHEGLEMLRRLLDVLWESRRRCLIGCDQWAWAFLCRTMQLDTLLPAPLIPHPFDAERLGRWFQALSQRDGGRPYVFRQADNGAYVLPRAASEDPEGATSEETAAFLRHLAGYSHGLPGVARSIWRHSLRASPDKDVQEDAASDEGADGGRVLWVTPWSQVRVPEAPASEARSLLFVLHALLLHDGLPASLLTAMLPLPPGEVARSLHQLQVARLVDVAAGRWRVTASGYPVVFRYIDKEGYLTPTT